jgi:hypothetical protein
MNRGFIAVFKRALSHDPIFSLSNPIQALTFYYCKIYFSIILQEKECSFLSRHVQTVFACSGSPIKLLPGVNQREHSAPSSVDVKETWPCAFTFLNAILA